MPKRKSKFILVTADEFRGLGPEKDLRVAVDQLLTICRIPHSVTDAALVVENGKVKGRAVWTPGFPDIVSCLPPEGKFFAFELKIRDGKLRPEQIALHAEIRAAGGVVVVPRSLNEVAQGLLDAGVEHEVLRKITKRK